MENFETWSSGLYPYLDTNLGGWVIAFNGDGRYYASANPAGDFYAPVPEFFGSQAAVQAAIAVCVCWENSGNGTLDFAALRATPAWARLAPHLPHTVIGAYGLADFRAAAALNGNRGFFRGALLHHRAMVAAGVKAVDN